MQLVSDNDFIDWLKVGGITNDPGWPRSQSLSLGGDQDHSRWWLPPPIVSDLPGFIFSAVELSSQAGPHWLYRRGGGTWYDGDGGTVRNQVIDRMVAITGIPRDFAGAVGLERMEWRDTLILTTAYYVFGWSVGEDLYIIPDDRRSVLMIGHHGDLSVSRASGEELAVFIEGMRQAGYELPDHIPDATFKRPEWMTPENGTA